MSDYQEIDDQASVCGDIITAHLKREDHKGKILDGCPFCEGFLKGASEEPIMSYKFMILDVTDDKTKI